MNADYLFRRRRTANPQTGIPMPKIQNVPSELEREFKSVFAMMPEAHRRDLVDGIMNRKRCSRTVAIRFAIDDRGRDERRWD